MTTYNSLYTIFSSKGVKNLDWPENGQGDAQRLSPLTKLNVRTIKS